jgi:cell division transport system permease protein
MDSKLQGMRHCLREAGEGLWRYPALTLLSTLSIAVTLYVFGLFTLLAFNLNRTVQGLGRELQMQVYLKPSASNDDIENLRTALLTDEAVAEATLVSPEEARRRFDEQFPGLSDLPGEVGGDIFPAAFEVKLRPGYNDPDAVDRLARAFRIGPGVDEVRFDRGWFEKLSGLITLVRGGGYGIGTLLLLAVMVTIGSVVRLTVLARREEIEIMKLVGATAAFIRAPFLLGAGTQGLLGGLAASGGLLLSWRLLVRSTIYRENPFMVLAAGRFLPPAGIAALAITGMLLGLLAATVSLWRAGSD